MKNALTLISVFITLQLSAQVPQSMNYQAIARNAAGQVISNQLIGLRFTVRNVTTGGAILYRETTSVTTNQLGLFTAAIVLIKKVRIGLLIGLVLGIVIVFTGWLRTNRK